MKKHATRRLVAACATACLALSACGGTDAGDQATDGPTSAGGGENVTISWWHNSNTGAGKDYYDKVAADYGDTHPGVTVKVTAMQHEDMVTKLEAGWQSGDVPNVYMERGGGELKAKVEAGLVKDLSETAADTVTKLGGSVDGWKVDDKTYALPFSVGVVGFWYNKDLFTQAGITDTPTTWEELYTDFDALKTAGITPVSVGAGDKWPAAHYWYYYSLRECSKDALNEAVKSLDFSDQCFIKAGEDLAKLVGAEPFNAGFLTTPAQSGPTSASGLLASGKVAMELAGHWEPGVMQGLTEDGKGLGDATGWFAFPQVAGQQGDETAALGGGDAWAVPADAPDQAVDFVQYLLSDEVQKGFAELDMGLPTNPTASQYVKDPNLADLLKVRDDAAYVQLYLDTAFGTSVGGAMNDEIALAFADQATPQDIVKAMQEAADRDR